MKWDELTKAILDEAKAMHHNASMLGCEAEFDDEELQDYLDYWMQKTSQAMQAKFGKTHLGISLVLTTYGRSRATIAPPQLLDRKCNLHRLQRKCCVWSRLLSRRRR